MSDDVDRIDRLEIDDLNGAGTAQWTALAELKRQIAHSLDRLADAERRLPAEPEPPPPHY